MFFKPPEVKAISRYSDFGSHLGVKTFTVMLTIAIALHASILIAYAMMPRSKVVTIPVRALNINLGANMNENIPANEQPPVPEPSHSLSPDLKIPMEAPGDKKKSAEVELDKALNGKKPEAPPKTMVTQKNSGKEKILLDKVNKGKGPVFSMPKKYVRESQVETVKAKDSKTTAKQEEVAQRYEQVISIWIRQHQVYPQEAKDRHAEGKGAVRVVLNRQGHITYYSIETSTGDAFLDKAAMAMVRASDPAPPVPEDYSVGDDQFSFVVALTWELEKDKK